MPFVPPITMKLVVTGVRGVISRRTSRSARRYCFSASDENRLKSSCCVGLGCEAASLGGRIWSQSLYRWDQKAVPQAWLSPSRVA
ncbi:hypothetical protein SALBM135S_10148 [Streptomyces alboniger]